MSSGCCINKTNVWSENKHSDFLRHKCFQRSSIRSCWKSQEVMDFLCLSAETSQLFCLSRSHNPSGFCQIVLRKVLFRTQWAQKESAAIERFQPEISRNPTGILKINHTRSRRASGHLVFTLNLSAPRVVCFSVHSGNVVHVKQQDHLLKLRGAELRHNCLAFQIRDCEGLKWMDGPLSTLCVCLCLHSVHNKT